MSVDSQFKNNSIRKILKRLKNEYMHVANVTFHAGNVHVVEKGAFKSTTLLDGTITFSMNLHTSDKGWEFTLKEVEAIVEAEGSALRHEVIAAFAGTVASRPDKDFQYFQITLFYPHSSKG